MSNETLQIMMDYYKQEQFKGAYQAARENKIKIDAFYSKVANMINAEKIEEIAFVDSASRGWNLAIYGSSISNGGDIITLSTEFGTNLITIFDYAKKIRATVHVIQCNEDGYFDISEIEQILKNKHDSKMIALSQATAQGSIVNPIVEIGQLAKKYNALYIVDGCQSVGQMSVDVQKMNCDAFVTSGRKWLCGPRGTGFLYVKQSSNINATQLDLTSADLILDDNLDVLDVKVRSDAKRFEIWERNIASVLGLSKAIVAIQSVGICKISQELSQKADAIRAAVISNNKLRLIGKMKSLSGIIGFYIIDPTLEEHVRKTLENKNLIISTMSNWDCPLAFPKNGVNTIFRLSPHYFTDKQTIDVACQAIKSI